MKSYLKIKADNDFFSYLVIEKYYNVLKEGKTPQMFNVEGAATKEICLAKDSNLYVLVLFMRWTSFLYCYREILINNIQF